MTGLVGSQQRSCPSSHCTHLFRFASQSIWGSSGLATGRPHRHSTSGQMTSSSGVLASASSSLPGFRPPHATVQLSVSPATSPTISGEHRSRSARISVIHTSRARLAARSPTCQRHTAITASRFSPRAGPLPAAVQHVPTPPYSPPKSTLEDQAEPDSLQRHTVGRRCCEFARTRV